MSWLKEERNRLGLSENRVAKMIGVSRPKYNQLEKEPTDLKLSQASVLRAAGFAVSSEEDLVAVPCISCGGKGYLFKSAKEELKL